MNQSAQRLLRTCTRERYNQTFVLVRRNFKDVLAAIAPHPSNVGLTRFVQLKEWFPRCHWENSFARNPIDAAQYCKKEGMWKERGFLTPKRQPESPSDWMQIITLIQSMPTWINVIANPSLLPLVSRNMNWARQIWEARPRLPPDLDVYAEGFKWQARFEIFLTRTKPDDRTVVYVANHSGNIGKSQFVKFMCAKHSHMMGVADDFKANCTMWEGQGVVFFDVARAQRLDYGVVEKLKDGVLIQTKYEIIYKSHGTPHIVIFSNRDPDVARLSADRFVAPLR